MQQGQVDARSPISTWRQPTAQVKRLFEAEGLPRDQALQVSGNRVKEERS